MARRVLTGALISFLVGNMTQSYAAEPSTVPKMKTEINSKARDLDKVQDELAKRKREHEELNRETKELSTVVEKSVAKIKDIERTLLHTLEQNSSIGQDVATTKNKRDQYQRSISEKKSSSKQQFVSYYLASALAGPSEFWTISVRESAHRTMAETRQLNSLREKEDDRFNELSLTFQALQSVVQDQTQALEDARYGKADKQKLLQKKLTRRQIVESEVAELQKTASELASLIEVLRSKAQKKTQEERRQRDIKAAEGRSPIGRKSLPWPVAGRVIQEFGRQDHGEVSVPFISNGLMIQPKEASVVKAVAGGEVLYVGHFMSYGPMVVLEHQDDWFSVYGHLSSWKVEKGQIIGAGDQVGESGISEKGAHEVYFELRFYGKPVDPRPWLN